MIRNLLVLLLINSSVANQITIALADASRVRWSHSGAARRGERDLLLPEIQRLLKRARKPLSAVQGIAVVHGPGPFSALRAGITAANALAYSLGVPAAGMSADEAHDLDAFAAAAAAHLQRAKVGELVAPAYGAEPNITPRPVI